LRKFIEDILLIIFLVTLLLVKTSNIALYLNKFSGLALAIIWLLYFVKKSYWTSALILYFMYIIYCFFLPLAIEMDIMNSMMMLKTMMQILILSFVIYNIYRYENSFIRISSILFIVSLIAYFGSYLNLIEVEVDIKEFSRFKGITDNANLLAFFLLYGLISSLYLISKNKKLSSVLYLDIISIIIFTILINNTGSRKSFIALILIIFFYLFSTLKKRIITMGIITLLFFLYSNNLIEYIRSETLMGQRFFDSSKFEGGKEGRIHLYNDAWEVFLKHPILGVGLDNFRLHSSTEHVAHSYFMEVLADTGVIGFLIIFPIYLILILKINFVRKRMPRYNLEIKFAIMFMMMYFVISFGFHLFNIIHHWIIMAVLLSFFDKAIKEYEKNSYYRK